MRRLLRPASTAPRQACQQLCLILADLDRVLDQLAQAVEADGSGSAQGQLLRARYAGTSLFHAYRLRSQLHLLLHPGSAELRLQCGDKGLGEGGVARAGLLVRTLFSADDVSPGDNSALQASLQAELALLEAPFTAADQSSGQQQQETAWRQAVRRKQAVVTRLRAVYPWFRQAAA